jgi:hypothetical protein
VFQVGVSKSVGRFRHSYVGEQIGPPGEKARFFAGMPQGCRPKALTILRSRARLNILARCSYRFRTSSRLEIKTNSRPGLGTELLFEDGESLTLRIHGNCSSWDLRFRSGRHAAIMIRTEISRERSGTGDRPIQQLTKSYIVHDSGMNSKPDDSACVVHHDQHPTRS